MTTKNKLHHKRESERDERCALLLPHQVSTKLCWLNVTICHPVTPNQCLFTFCLYGNLATSHLSQDIETPLTYEATNTSNVIYMKWVSDIAWNTHGNTSKWVKDIPQNEYKTYHEMRFRHNEIPLNIPHTIDNISKTFLMIQ